MELENSFVVPAGIDEAWAALLDVERVAPCMPGATLTGVDGDEVTGTVRVKVGPITINYNGRAVFRDRDVAAHTVVLEASGKESKAVGTATAIVHAALFPDGDDSTKVVVRTDLTVTGRPAKFGRGVINDVAGKIIGQFADALAAEMSATSTPAPAWVAEAPAPTSVGDAPVQAADTAQPAQTLGSARPIQPAAAAGRAGAGPARRSNDSINLLAAIAAPMLRRAGMGLLRALTALFRRFRSTRGGANRAR